MYINRPTGSTLFNFTHHFITQLKIRNVIRYIKSEWPFSVLTEKKTFYRAICRQSYV